MRKVAGYDYPYKVWPDDYPHESLYPDSVVTEIAAKHKFQDLPLLRSVLVKSAMFYFGYKDSHSPGSPTDSSIRREIKDLHARTEKYLAQLRGISREAFEAMAWELCSPNVPPHDVPSHFEQRAFYEDQNISKPTIEEFYTDHTGYAKLGNLQQELQSLLDAAADVLNEMVIAKASVATHSFFTPIKGDGPKRLAYNKLIEILAIHWENTGHGKPPVYGKEGEPNAFLSFAYDAIFPITQGKDEVATRQALYRAMENYLARRHPSEFS